jgi:hypothetical protein
MARALLRAVSAATFLSKMIGPLSRFNHWDRIPEFDEMRRCRPASFTTWRVIADG